MVMDDWEKRLEVSVAHVDSLHGRGLGIVQEELGVTDCCQSSRYRNPMRVSTFVNKAYRPAAATISRPE